MNLVGFRGRASRTVAMLWGGPTREVPSTEDEGGEGQEQDGRRSCCTE